MLKHPCKKSPKNAPDSGTFSLSISGFPSFPLMFSCFLLFLIQCRAVCSEPNLCVFMDDATYRSITNDFRQTWFSRAIIPIADTELCRSINFHYRDRSVGIFVAISHYRCRSPVHFNEFPLQIQTSGSKQIWFCNKFGYKGIHHASGFAIFCPP